jgi:membrane-anchored glycerophosphoryl diester phosphodiesterase (GDPDase)
MYSSNFDEKVVIFKLILKYVSNDFSTFLLWKLLKIIVCDIITKNNVDNLI